MSRKRTLLVALGLSLGGLLASLVLAEGAVRLLGLFRPAYLEADFDRPEYIAKPDPERRHLYVDASQEPFKMAVIGDSFTEGQSNLYHSAYPVQLEHLLNLNADARPVKVLRFAQRGTSTTDQRRYLNQAREQGAELIVLAIFLNDTESSRDPLLPGWRDRLRPRRVKGTKLEVLRRVHLLGWLYQRLELARSQRAQAEFTRYLFDPESLGWLAFEQAISYFDRHCSDWGIDFVAMIFPPMAALDAEVYPYQYAHDQIAAVLAKRRIPYLDLLGAYRGKSPMRMAAYPGVDAHPSEIAHRIAAEALFGFLTRKGYFDDTYVPNNYVREGPRFWLRQRQRMYSVLFFEDIAQEDKARRAAAAAEKQKLVAERPARRAVRAQPGNLGGDEGQ